jgi:hypothetical protein
MGHAEAQRQNIAMWTKLAHVCGIRFMIRPINWAGRRYFWKYFLLWIGIRWAAKLGVM